MTVEMKEEAETMCGIGHAIARKNLEEGMQKGLQKGRLEGKQEGMPCARREGWAWGGVVTEWLLMPGVRLHLSGA